jgi:hypothetical protein
MNMRNVWIMAMLSLALVCEARAEVLTLSCENARGTYAIRYDADQKQFTRKDGDIIQTYRLMRVQVDRGDTLVWGATRAQGGDVLAFFGSKTMMKYFYGNGSETTDTCTQH